MITRSQPLHEEQVVGVLCSWSLAWLPGGGGDLLAEPEPGLLPQISSDGSGGVAPAWHVTLLLDVSLPRSVKAEA